MNLEFLLAFTCWFSNSQEACYKAGEAYYHYEKLDEIANRINEEVKNKYPPVFFTTILLSSYEKRKLNVPVYKGTYFGWEFPDREEPRLNVGWELGF